MSAQTQPIDVEATPMPHTGLLVMLSFIALLLMLRLCYLFLADVQRFPINTVKIAATYQHISHKQLESVLSSNLQASFFSLSVSKLQQALSRIDWVDQASVERIWPDTVKITLVEKQPIARFGDDLLTADGQLFHPKLFQDEMELPQLSGPAEQKTEILQIYQKLSKILVDYGLHALALRLRANQAWELSLSNDLKLYLGKEDIEQRLLRFCKAYTTQFAETTEHLASVDLRYPRGMAVQWKK